MAAAAALTEPRPMQAAALADPPPPPAAPYRDSAERRPITVMFCDLVGSTSLAAQARRGGLARPGQRISRRSVQSGDQFGGHVLKKLGDGLMALFGYPQAQENDAERAARAGLAILRAFDELNARNVARGLPALAARIGLETGPSSWTPREKCLATPRMSPRGCRAPPSRERFSLQRPSSVRSRACSSRKTRGRMSSRASPAGPRSTGSCASSGGGRRGGARSLTPLVGREEELAALERRWERAKAGDGQFVQIVGEPGLGKSRLTEELRARLAAAPHTWVAVVVLATAAEHAAASDCGMGAATLWRRGDRGRRSGSPNLRRRWRR